MSGSESPAGAVAADPGADNQGSGLSILPWNPKLIPANESSGMKLAGLMHTIIRNLPQLTTPVNGVRAPGQPFPGSGGGSQPPDLGRPRRAPDTGINRRLPI